MVGGGRKRTDDISMSFAIGMGARGGSHILNGNGKHQPGNRPVGKGNKTRNLHRINETVCCTTATHETVVT